jgi:hypothetical protein
METHESWSRYSKPHIHAEETNNLPSHVLSNPCAGLVPRGWVAVRSDTATEPHHPRLDPATRARDRRRALELVAYPAHIIAWRLYGEPCHIRERGPHAEEKLPPRTSMARFARMTEEKPWSSFSRAPAAAFILMKM